MNHARPSISPPPVRSTGRRAAALALVAAAATAGWWVFGHGAPTDKAAPAATAPQPVVVRMVERKPMPVLITAIGNVQPLSVVSVRPRVEGEVVKVHFAEGQEVKQGDLLFTLDLRSSEAARRQAEAAQARDRAQLERARSDLKRYGDLLKSGNAPVQKVEQITADVAVLEAALKADAAAIDTARLAIEYGMIRSPISGHSGVINAKQGNLAKPGDSQPMVTLTQMRPIYVSFSVPEANLPRIRAAQGSGPLAVAVASASDAALAETGVISFVDSAIDTATGTIGLKATFDNAATRLWPGQFVNVSLTLGTEADALAIPTEAVQVGQSGPFVFVVTPQDRAEIRPVTIDRTIGREAVIAKGLQAGERVVVEGQQRLGQGTLVADRKTP
jgi:membrane fusion protein, multidrug efflux system